MATSSDVSLPGDNVGVPDSTQLPKLTEEAVVTNLKKRYDARQIHTFVGPVLVVLNPYRDYPENYSDRIKAVFPTKRLARAPPHVYAVAEEVRRRGGGALSRAVRARGGRALRSARRLRSGRRSVAAAVRGVHCREFCVLAPGVAAGVRQAQLRRGRAGQGTAHGR
jgi:hypothetical protein